MSEIFNLRQALKNDVSVVQELVREAYDKYLVRMDVPPGPLRDGYAQLIADGVVWLADDGKRTTGPIVLIPQSDHLLLDNVAGPLEHAGQDTQSATLDRCEPDLVH